MKYRFFSLITRSYTHVGQGAADTGVIDNLIQREKPNGIPVMHNSSIKGAFRSHCKEILGYDEDKLNLLFGTNDDSNGSNGTDKAVYQSMLVFHDARLLFLPVGALYEQATYYATSPNALQRYYSMANKLLGKNENHTLSLPAPGSNFCCYKSDNPNILPDIEGISGSFLQVAPDVLNSSVFREIKTGEVALFEEARFRDICKYCIPVIERNCLNDDGVSKNKFNEEVLPYGAHLWFFLSYPNDLLPEWEVQIERFIAEIQNTYVQIGANFSLAQGLCEIQELKDDNPTEQ